jgi:hypothetical protein
MNNEQNLIQELLQSINPKTNKTTEQMLIDLKLYAKGETITLEELMKRIKSQIDKIGNNFTCKWARFKSLIRGNTEDEILFVKNDKTNNTRYAILKEDKEYYYIATEANNINCIRNLQINKTMCNAFADIVEETLEIK